MIRSKRRLAKSLLGAAIRHRPDLSVFGAWMQRAVAFGWERSGWHSSFVVIRPALIVLAPACSSRCSTYSAYQGMEGAKVLDKQPTARSRAANWSKPRRRTATPGLPAKRKPRRCSIPRSEPPCAASARKRNRERRTLRSRLVDLSRALSRSRERHGGTELTYDGERHLLLFGPNGSGKGTRLLVPNLLRLKDRSLVVIDPKGELTAITADYRRTVGEVVVLNPFDVLGLGGAGFNPLAALDPEAPTFVDDAAGLGEALIKIEDKDPHWSESAQSLLVALIMWEVQSARRENRAPLLENVRRMLTEPDEYERDEDGKKQARQGPALSRPPRWRAMGGFEIESLVGRFLRDTDEIASIQSTADRQTSWMLSPLDAREHGEERHRLRRSQEAARSPSI